MGSYIRGRIAGDQKVADKWAKYASDNSYHPTASEKAGGAPKMQDSNVGRFTARDTRANCGQIASYRGTRSDEMAKSPAHWEMPASDKGSAAQEQKQLNPARLGFRSRAIPIGFVLPKTKAQALAVTQRQCIATRTIRHGLNIAIPRSIAMTRCHMAVIREWNGLLRRTGSPINAKSKLSCLTSP